MSFKVSKLKIVNGDDGLEIVSSDSELLFASIDIDKIDYNNYLVTSKNIFETNNILSHSIADISENLVLNLKWLTREYFDFYLFIDIPSAILDNKRNYQSINIKILMNTDLRNWNHSFKFSDYEVMFKRNLLNQSQEYTFNNPNFYYYNLIHGNSDDLLDSEDFLFYLETCHSFNSLPIQVELDSVFELLNRCHTNTISDLIKVNQNKLKYSFEFPIEIEVYCKNYLNYFVEFLRDLNIEATSQLNEEAGKVLFSIDPRDKNEALDKIREALAVYLSLPSSPIVFDESFAAMRLQQQIENLQHSQKMVASEIRMAGRELLLAQTVIEQQDSLIRQKDSVIEQQNKVIEKIISPTLMMDSLVDNDKEELEKIYDGLEAGHSKWLFELTGIKANLFKVIKTAVKNTLGKDDEDKSILDLDGKE